MGDVIEADDWDAWRELFEFHRSAYRLETLQTYVEPEEAEVLAQFLAGENAVLDTSWWESMIGAHHVAGRTVTRARVLVEPLSDYVRFQLPYFTRFVDAGEDIRILAAREGTWPEGIPPCDYWLFDDRDVWAMHYTDAGTFVRAELLDNPIAIADHRRWRDIALAQAVPLHDYLTAHPATSVLIT